MKPACILKWDTIFSVYLISRLFWRLAAQKTDLLHIPIKLCDLHCCKAEENDKEIWPYYSYCQICWHCQQINYAKLSLLETTISVKFAEVQC